MTDFFPETHLQQIIRATDGKRCVYLGQEAYFHDEEPTRDDVFSAGEFQGLAKILVGDVRSFDGLEENKLLTVDGEDFLVADWKTSLDGKTLFIALKTSKRT